MLGNKGGGIAITSDRYTVISGSVINATIDGGYGNGGSVLEVTLQMNATGDAAVEFDSVFGWVHYYGFVLAGAPYAPVEAITVVNAPRIGTIARLPIGGIVAVTGLVASDTAPRSGGGSQTTRCAGPFTLTVSTPTNGANNSGKRLTIVAAFNLAFRSISS